MSLQIWHDGDVRAPVNLVCYELPLGSIIVASHHVLESEVMLARLCLMAEASPWVHVVSPPSTLLHLRAILPASTRVVPCLELATVGASRPGNTPDRFAMMDVPSLKDFLSHISARIGVIPGGLVAELFSAWCGTKLYRRAFRRHSLPTPNDWYDLWLQLYAQGKVSPNTLSVSSMARVRKLSVPEFSAQVERLFRTPMPVVTALPWTARVELFLRGAGLTGVLPNGKVAARSFDQRGLRRQGAVSRRALYVGPVV